MGERTEGFEGGAGQYVVSPDIVPMRFGYRNPVSGRVPEHYQPDCAPCEVRPGWSMTEYGYERRPTGRRSTARTSTRLGIADNNRYAKYLIGPPRS